MERGKTLILSIVVLLVLTGVASATVCCEKTTGGAWCQNAESESDCATGINPVTGAEYRTVETLCDLTGSDFCKLGTCIDDEEGACSSTAYLICTAAKGTWKDAAEADVEQCQLGCCLIGSQASFITETRCLNVMSILYPNVNIEYKSSINNELVCLASANLEDEGACVYTSESIVTCAFETKEECQTRAKNSAYSDVSFHKDYLCTAEDLKTNCAKTKETACDDSYNVRFVDSCGNFANIYDSSVDDSYWTTVQSPDCSDGEGNKDSATCGDCDYISGSMCKETETGDTVDYGNYICNDLDCNSYTGSYNGSDTGYATGTDYPRHGETWCASDSLTSDKDAPGATYYRLACYNGEVTPEACDSTRQKVCSEAIIDETSDFREANCVTNIWQDCTFQNTSEDCLDTSLRDCVWLDKTEYNGYYFTENGLKNETSSTYEGMCVPLYKPGFSSTDDSTTDNCGYSSSICYVKMEKGLTDKAWECLNEWSNNNCSCIDDADGNYDGGVTWAKSLNPICTQLGDCGVKNNSNNFEGYYTDYSDLIILTNRSGDENATA